MKNVSVLIFGLCLLPQIVLARPEYALREKAACINCHVSPFGGDHRNQFGKMYGSRKLGQPITNDYRAFYGDFRVITKRNEGTAAVRGKNGYALMTAQISGNVVLTEEETGFNTSATASIDTGSVGQPVPRNAYVLFTNADKKALVYTVLVGKTYIPFGLLTDDHRSFLRMQTNTEFNKHLENQVTVSGTPFFAVHYDLTLMNGFQNNNFNSGDETIGGNANLNWNPSDLPFLVGASHVMHYSKIRKDGQSPYATSFYGILDLREPTNDVLPVSILGEVVFAKHFNNYLSDKDRFINSNTNPNTWDFVKDKNSRGISAQVKWDITKQWQLALRHEQLLLADKFPGDAYLRETAALNYQFTANSSLLGTYEMAKSKNKNLNPNGNLFADTDAFFVLFRTWL